MRTPFQRKPLAHLCAVALLTTAAAGSALAQTAATDVTRGAVAVTTTMGQFSSEFANSGPVSLLIDRSGLSSPYVSGVTAFNSFVTSAVHSDLEATVWISSVETGFLSFDLGTAYNINGLAWFGLVGEGTSVARVSGIKVYADNDGDATNGNAGLLFDSGKFSTAAGSTENFSKANVFSFNSAANTRYLDIEIVSNVGAPISGLGEVVFRQTAAVAAVPEPGTYALMGLGLLAIGYTQRRRMVQR